MRIQSDQSGAFIEVFRSHRGRLYQFLRRRLANEDDARELAQETYLRLLRVTRNELIKDPQAYLYRVARNLVYEQNGKSLPAESLAGERELEVLEDPQPSLEVATDRSRRLELIEQAVAELPPRLQSVVLLFCREGLSQSEIAARVGLSKSMVQKYLATGVAHCRKRLRRFRES